MEHEKLLSAGAIAQILEGGRPANPVLQIIGFKAMTPDQMAFGAQTEELRYRLMVGDGVTAHQYCVITNQDLVEDIKSGRLEKWSVIKVTSYQTVEYDAQNAVQKRRLIYILNLEVLRKGSEIGSKLTCQAPNTTNQQQNQPPYQQQNQPPYQQQNQPSYQHQNQPPQQQFRPQPPQMQQQFQQPSPTIRNNQNRANEDLNPYGRPQGGNNFNQNTQPQPYGGGYQANSIKSPQSSRTYDQQTIGIAELTPYIGKWVIKGRVVTKSAVREYNNAKGGGKVFSFTLTDKTGEIKVTAFNADLERVYEYVQPNKVYHLGRATVKAADKRYSQSDFEVTLNSDSLLEEVVDATQASDVPLAKFNFVSIGQLQNIPTNQPVDMIGAITDVGEFTTIMSRTKNKELKKRDITIVDISRHSIQVTIWGDSAETFNGVEGDVFVTKGARVSTWAGRSSSAGDYMFVNPDIPETRKIRNWYSNLLERNFKALTSSQEGGPSGGDQWRYLDELQNMEAVKTALSSGQTGLYGKVKVTLTSVGRNPVYKCCPQEGCGKKLTDTQNGELKCEKCQQTYATFKYRYKTDIDISDNTSSSWVTLWDEKAENIFKMKPEDLERKMREEATKDEYDKIISRPNFQQYILTLRARIDNYNNEERVRLNPMSMTPLDSTMYTKQLITQIKGMLGSKV